MTATLTPAGTTASLLQMLVLTDPLPGFPGHRDYVLVPAGGAGLLYWLQSAAPEGPRFLAVPAAAYFPDYAPALPGAVCVEPGLGFVHCRIEPFDQRPEARGMIHLDEMRDFMGGNVVEYERRREDQAPGVGDDARR